MLQLQNSKIHKMLSYDIFVTTIFPFPKFKTKKVLKKLKIPCKQAKRFRTDSLQKGV
jgi:hypothetical protein